MFKLGALISRCRLLCILVFQYTYIGIICWTWHTDKQPPIMESRYEPYRIAWYGAYQIVLVQDPYGSPFWNGTGPILPQTALYNSELHHTNHIQTSHCTKLPHTVLNRVVWLGTWWFMGWNLLVHLIGTLLIRYKITSMPSVCYGTLHAESYRSNTKIVSVFIATNLE